MSRDLIVHYGKPPVAEVVLGVQFTESIIDLDVLAEFGRAIRESFPKREQHEPLMPTREELAAGAVPATVEFQIVQEFPFPRTWFVSEDGHRLIQLKLIGWYSTGASSTTTMRITLTTTPCGPSSKGTYVYCASASPR